MQKIFVPGNLADRTEGFRRIFILLFVFLCLVVTVSGAMTGMVEHAPWKIGDWLINYNGGFIRRGAAGAALINVARWLDLSPGILVVAIQVVLYSLYFYFSARLLMLQVHLKAFLLLVFSPFVYTFQINDFEGGYRKEIAFFAVLSYLAYSRISKSDAEFKLRFFVLLYLYPVLILSHELLAVFLPYVIMVYLYDRPMRRPDFAWLAGGVALSFASLIAAFAFKGTVQQETAIRESLVNLGYSIQGGAIDWLHNSTEFASNSVLSLIREKSYLKTYLIVILLTGVAYIPVRKTIFQLHESALVKFASGASWLGTVVVATIAIDWGRLIYIHAVSLFVLALMVRPTVAPSTEVAALPAVRQPFRKGLLYFFIIVWLTMWHIPHTGKNKAFASNPKRTNVGCFAIVLKNGIESMHQWVALKP